MNDPHSTFDRPDDAELEELVAYLDGELAPEQAQEVEQRLVSDPQYRTRLQELERTWEMLDLLPQHPISDNFTETTVELVAVQAEQDVQTRQLEVVRKRRSLRLVLVFATLGACIAGFGLIWSWQQRDQRRFLQDLPIVEELDMYRVAESVEFLESLEERGLFTESEEVDDDEL